VSATPADGAKERLREKWVRTSTDVDWKKLDPMVTRAGLSARPSSRTDDQRMYPSIVQPNSESAYAERKRLMAESSVSADRRSPADGGDLNQLSLLRAAS
jgi:hypothetical protein